MLAQLVAQLAAQLAAMEQRLLAVVKPEGTEYLTHEEAAAYLRLTDRQLRDLCRDQRITHARFDYRTYRFKRTDLDEWFEAYKVKRKSVYD
jgi:excisionase family DNA binding protein